MSSTLSKNLAKLIKSLDSKKGRTKHGLFLAEGSKLVSEMLQSKFELYTLICTKDDVDKFNIAEKKLIVDTSENIKKVSLQKTPQNTLAVFKIPEQTDNPKVNTHSLNVCLDGVQDPGNIGTIVRTCSWYNIKNVICSKDTVDIYNPKAIQASMGGLRNVEVHYTDLHHFLSQHKNMGLPIITTQMEGEAIYSTKLPKSAFLVLGNEGRGVSEEVVYISDTKIAIPSFHGNIGTESLNVSIANAVFCHEYRRNNK